MTKGAIVCQACGAKVSATRTRCPRCRELLVTETPKEAHVSGGAAKIAGGVLAVALVATVVILWRSGDAPPPASPAKAVKPAATAAPAAAAVADVPPAPTFQLASGLTPVPESTDDAAALAGFERTLERDPEDAATMYNIGRVLLRQRRPIPAVAPLRRAFALKPDNFSYAFTAGYAYALAGEFPEAVRAFRIARGLMPSDAVTSYDLALALQRAGDFAGAAGEYAAAIRLNAEPVSARLGRAISLDRLGNATEAVAEYEECLRIMSPGPEADRIRARMVRLRGPAE